MNRTDAVNQLAQKALSKLNPKEREEQLEVMMLESWNDSPGWKKLKWGVRREFRKQQLKFNPTDSRYDAVFLIWLRSKFSGYTNHYLSSQLSQQEIIGMEPDCYPCPCCGYKTIGEVASYDICLICWWEDDGQNDEDADKVTGGPNDNISLTQARINFVTCGLYNPKRTDLMDKKDDTAKYIRARAFQLDEEGNLSEVNVN